MQLRAGLRQQIEKYTLVVKENYDKPEIKEGGRSKFGEFASYPSIELGEYGLELLIDMFDCVSELDHISDGAKFLDMGAGDGLIVFLANLYGFKAYGIEHQDRLVKASNIYRNEFDIMDCAKIVQGDYFEGFAYQELGVSFSEMNFIYIYPSAGRLQRTYDLVSEYSEEGTILAVKSSSENRESILPVNLDLMKTIKSNYGRIDVYSKE